MSSVAKPPKRTSTLGILAPMVWLRGSRRARQLVGLAIVAVLGVAAAVVLWRQVRPHVEGQREYLVSVSDLEITPSPAWIHSDVKSEAIRHAGLTSKMSILDDRAADRITQAFSLHPWVARVNNVSTSYPAHIRVELTFRQPVAMVEVAGGLLPIDVNAVLLPTGDFSPTEAQSYPRIAGIESSPLGPVGARWGDADVETTAKLANLLNLKWQELRLHHIQIGDPTTTTDRAALQLVTRGGAKFVWGSSVGAEQVEERSAKQKIERLGQMAAEFGSLDATPADRRDLRQIQ